MFFLLQSFRYPVLDLPKHFSHSLPILIWRALSATVRPPQAFSNFSITRTFSMLLYFSLVLLPRLLFGPSSALATAELEAVLIRVAPLTFGAMSLGFSFIFSVTIVVNQSTALFFCNSMRFRTLLAAYATLQLNLWPPNACVVWKHALCSLHWRLGAALPSVMSAAYYFPFVTFFSLNPK